MYLILVIIINVVTIFGGIGGVIEYRRTEGKNIRPTRQEYIQPSEGSGGLRSLEGTKFKIASIRELEADACSGIEKRFLEVGSPRAKDVIWVCNEAIQRGLNPRIVLAIFAEESGWGRSSPCLKYGNCFGYNYTATTNGDGYKGEFRKTTKKILEAFKRNGYAVSTAEATAQKGYNQHPEWIVKVNSIMSSFN